MVDHAVVENREQDQFFLKVVVIDVKTLHLYNSTNGDETSLIFALANSFSSLITLIK